jgi:hypothetical protein
MSAAALQLPATIRARWAFDISNSPNQRIPADSGACTLASGATPGPEPDSVGQRAAAAASAHYLGDGVERVLRATVGKRDLRDERHGYVLGLALAIALTLASFWVARTPIIYGPGVPVALVALAVAQMGMVPMQDMMRM